MTTPGVGLQCQTRTIGETTTFLSLTTTPKSIVQRCIETHRSSDLVEAAGQTSTAEACLEARLVTLTMPQEKP